MYVRSRVLCAVTKFAVNTWEHRQLNGRPRVMLSLNAGICLLFKPCKRTFMFTEKWEILFHTGIMHKMNSVRKMKVVASFSFQKFTRVDKNSMFKKFKVSLALCFFVFFK